MIRQSIETGRAETRRGPESGDTMVRGTRRSAVWAVLACVASACGSETPTGPPSVAAVVVSPSPASVRVGELIVLSATAEDQGGNRLTGRAVTWTSVNAAVASVASGVVSGISEGTTNVSAVVDGTPGTVTVTVTPAGVSTVDVRPVVAQVLLGATIQMTATPRSASGTPLTGRAISWASSDLAIATVSPTGLVTGVAGGDVTITATVEQQLGSGDLGVLDPTAPRITAITPYPLIEGGTGTLVGVNFGATPGGNVVTVDGISATVTAGDGTSVTFTVPTTGCRPHRSVPVRVTAGGKSGTLAHPVRPAVFTQVGVGEQFILGGPGAPCLQFDGAPSFESYLVGVQSVSENAASLSAVQVVSRTGLSSGGSTAGSPTATPAPSAAPATPVTLETLPVLQAHARRHTEARGGEADLLRSGALDFQAAAAGALQSAIPPNASVGQRFTVRVPSHYPGSCTQFTTIQAELRLITPRGQWLVDVASLAGGYTNADLQSIADDFQGDVAPALEPMFGTIPDTDNNPRIAFVVSERVNQEGWLSYPSLYDYLPTSQCAASNEGDYLYLATPGTGSFSSAFLLEVMGYSLSHDFTHVIQNRAVIGGGTRAPAWIEEGQAALGEETFAHRLTSRAPRQNYGQNVMFATIGQIQPFSMVGGLAYYFGFLDSTSPKITGAPEQCTWLDPQDGGPASSGPCPAPGPSSGAWAFLRWLTDHYGSVLGGDGILQRGLIDASGPGFDRVESLVGVPIETLLARFAASLYVDDRITLADATLGFPSWNLLEFDQAVFAAGRLTPRTRGFATYTDTGSVRGASTLYYTVGGSGRPATAIEITGPSGAPLSAGVQVWIVRLQ
ncbi:MAG: hypothetical protein EXR91_06830 [Gemmatimonadetes bacterium]|nr:hypothetical protein [Gemmatimonadota bacterium]